MKLISKACNKSWNLCFDPGIRLMASKPFPAQGNLVYDTLKSYLMRKSDQPPIWTWLFQFSFQLDRISGEWHFLPINFDKGTRPQNVLKMGIWVRCQWNRILRKLENSEENLLKWKVIFQNFSAEMFAHAAPNQPSLLFGFILNSYLVQDNIVGTVMFAKLY